MPNLGPFNPPRPQYRTIDVEALARAKALPEVTRQQGKAKLFENLANLPTTLFNAASQMQEYKSKQEMGPIEKRYKEAQIGEVEAQKKEREARANLLGRGHKPKSYVRSIGGKVVAFQIGAGNEILGTKELGIDSATSMRVRDSVAAFGSSENMINQIEDLSKRIITATSPGGALAQYTGLTLGALAKSSPDAATYLGIRKAFLASLSRASGEKGVLTDQDLERILSALPGEGDTMEIAASKIAEFRTLYENIRDSAIKAYTAPMSELTATTQKKKTPQMAKPSMESLNFK